VSPSVIPRCTQMSVPSRNIHGPPHFLTIGYCSLLAHCYFNSCTWGSHLTNSRFTAWVSVIFPGKKWLQGKLYVGRRATPFKVIFEAERSYNVFGDIAIDDISFVNCSLPPVVSNCRRGQHRCARGSCIDPSRLCDYSDDCGDNSDEMNCYSYNYR